MRFMLTLALAAAPMTAWTAPIEIGAQRELFVDDYLIESMEGVSLRMHAPVECETVLRFDAPWEGRYCGYVTVIDDGGTYRMYYRGLPRAKADGSNLEVTCYAESDDGIAWRKPELGLFEVEGSTANNVILAGAAPLSHNFAPFLDTRPGVDPDARFKALAGTKKSGLIAFASGDGIRWRKLQEAPVLTDGAFDSQNVASWSETEQQYVSYYRTWSEGDFGGFRWVSRSTSPDFLNWTDGVEMNKGDAPWEHIYTNQTLPYFRAPQVYVAMAARFMPGRRVVTAEEAAELGVEAQYSGDCSDVVLMTSRGGTRYNRTFLSAFVRPGIGLENWTSRTNYPARGILPTGDRELSVYVQHNYGQPTGHLARYTIRPDGFASAYAPYAGGELVTKPIAFTGSDLFLNFATSAAGSVRVAVLDAEGNDLEGFTLADCPELIGNFLDRRVPWRGGRSIEELAGTPVRLRFVLKDADLYALQFRKTD